MTRRTKPAKERRKSGGDSDHKKSDDGYNAKENIPLPIPSAAEIRKRVTTRAENNTRQKARQNRMPKNALSVVHMISPKILLSAAACIILISGLAVFRYRQYIREKVRTPLNLPKLVHPNISTAQFNPKSYWGTYRPNTYFGMKTRHPRAPVFGMMWIDQMSSQMPPSIRHWCNQDDRLPSYGWLMHDGLNFGMQQLDEQHFTIKTQFVKRVSGENGGDWTTRINVVPKGEKAHLVSVMFYMALDGQGRVEPVIKNDRLTALKGVTTDLGYFSVDFAKPTGSDNIKRNYLISSVPQLDKINEITMSGLTMSMWDRAKNQGYFSLGGRLVPRDSPTGPNFFMYQVTGTPPFEFEVIFESGSVHDRPERLAGSAFNKELLLYVDKFDKKFNDVFQLESRHYSQEDISVAKSALSNMLGGIGYFYGSSLVKSPYNDQPVDYWPAPLHTAVPSRSFFPRGFLWDEGFHNLLISQWDMSISHSIISHWLDLMNVEGWIPREQILGLEARARVPAEFIVQRNENANPPTWFLVLPSLVRSLSQDEDNLPYLHVLYSRLKVWYRWYNTTQSGPEPGTYRWRGRDILAIKQLNPLTLTSGIDDYPRASHPTTHEYHIDLRCWISLASGVMAEISRVVGEDPKIYEETRDYLSDNSLLDKLHWSEETQSYSDYGLHTEGVKLEKRPPPPNHRPGQPLPPEYDLKVRVVTEQPKYQLIKSFGYVSLFPFMTKILDPSSPKLIKILNDIKDPRLLWTDYGLRSLAKNAQFYDKFNTEIDPPYWRGPIWINMNYLTVAALYHYSHAPGPYIDLAKGIYKDLRSNLIGNIIRQYKLSGYIWEHYDDKTGKGKGSHPFTGWSATFVLMMSEKY